MSIAPLASAIPAAAPAVATGDATALPGDFLAVIQAAMSQAAPVVEPTPVAEPAPVVELAETADPAPVVELPPVLELAETIPNSVAGPTPTDGPTVDGPTPTDSNPPLVEEAGLQHPQPTGDHSADPAAEPEPDPVVDVVDVVAQPAPAPLTALIAQQLPVAVAVVPPAARQAAAPASATDEPVASPQAAPTPADRPNAAPRVLAHGAAHDSAVTGTTNPAPEPASVPAEAGPTTAPVPVTALQTATPQPAQPPAHAGAQPAPAITSANPVAPAAPSAPVANTTPLDKVSAQVFPEVTGLVSRGNGTHRITLTLNPEQLGEVRVVMTMRDGNVHVRLAAGHEAKASLLDGSPELARLLERAGATEARVVVRDLLTSPVPANTTTGTPTAGDPALGGDRSPDQHAGTRADHHTARDGSQTPRSTRTEGTTATGTPPRPIDPVTGTRVAGVDLTM